ncbi:MAG: hypothetical protein V2I33_00990 [Kangiellaceae bacterium]|jgi:TPR repeat protein|nr:hypothetical protein [Kangiellaceae bacterium]
MRKVHTLILSALLSALTATSGFATTNIHPESKRICGEMTCDQVRLMLKRSAYRGRVQAQKLVAIMYIDAIGREKNYQQAAMYLRMAVDRNDAESALMLAELYNGVYKTDKDKYNKLIKKAAKITGVDEKTLIARENKLLISYSDKVTLSDAATRIRRPSDAYPAYSTGSFIIGQRCRIDGLNRCQGFEVQNGLYIPDNLTN